MKKSNIFFVIRPDIYKTLLKICKPNGFVLKNGYIGQFEGYVKDTSPLILKKK